MFLFCSAFHKAPQFNSECFLGEKGGGGGGGGGGSYTCLDPALLVVLFWLAFLSVSLFIVCFSGIAHNSQPVAG